MKLSLVSKLTALIATILALAACGASTESTDPTDDELFKQGPSKGTRYFTSDYQPDARVGLDGLWLMEEQFGSTVDALEFHEEEEVVVYARRCRFAGGKSLFTYVEVDVDLKANNFVVLEDKEYTAIDTADTRLRCPLALVEDTKLYFRVVDKDMLLSTSRSMRSPIRFYKVRDNK
jgi:hypothetical protein